MAGGYGLQQLKSAKMFVILYADIWEAKKHGLKMHDMIMNKIAGKVLIPLQTRWVATYRVGHEFLMKSKQL